MPDSRIAAQTTGASAQTRIRERQALDTGLRGATVRLRCRAAAALVLALLLCACAGLAPAPSTPAETAVVTGIMSGRASVPGEKTYVLRSANGRVFFVAQVTKTPLKEGEVVELERLPNDAARIRER